MFQLLEYSVHNLTEENRIQKFLIFKKKLLYVYIACLLHNSLLFFTVVQKKLMLSGKRDVDRPREELEEAWGGPSSHAYVTIFDGVHVCRWLASYNLWFADKWIFRGITRQSSGLSSSSQMHFVRPCNENQYPRVRVQFSCHTKR
mgnify:CR=1 FL=1